MPCVSPVICCQALRWKWVWRTEQSIYPPQRAKGNSTTTKPSNFFTVHTTLGALGTQSVNSERCKAQENQHLCLSHMFQVSGVLVMLNQPSRGRIPRTSIFRRCTMTISKHLSEQFYIKMYGEKPKFFHVTIIHNMAVHHSICEGKYWDRLLSESDIPLCENISRAAHRQT